VELNALVPALSRPLDIDNRMRAIGELERKGHEIYSEGVGSLLREGANPQQAIVCKHVYTSLAVTMGSCRSVGQLAQMIAIKNV